MKQLRFRKGSWILIPILVLSIFSSPAKADTFTTEGANDFYFNLDAGNTFTLRTYAAQYGIDSMLWLYNSTNQIVASNDDHYGLDSYISYNVQQSGVYRLRTGVCCGNPDAWRGSSYVIETGFTPTAVPPTTPSTTTTSTTTTTTTLPPLVMASPTNLVAHAYDGRVSLSWDPPQAGNGYAEPERYAVFFSSDNWQTSYAISSTNTWATIYNLENGTTYEFRVRADNDTLHTYSSLVETFTVSATPVTTTTTTTSTTTSTTTTTTTTTVPPTTTTSTTVYIPIPVFTTTTQPATTTVAPTTTTIPPTTTTVTVTTTTTEPPKGVDQEVSNLIENTANLSPKEIVSAVENIIQNGVSKEEASVLATKAEILQSVSSEQAKEIFQELAINELTPDQEQKLVEALATAPDDVKETFEGEIDIFGEGLDDYVPTGSGVDVKTRRALIAVTTTITTITTAPMTTGGGSAPSGGGAGGPSGDGGSDNGDRKKSRSRRK